MRKLHKKYIFLNVFLIIYIMSLSVGYAYFSESIQATGTAKTLEYSNMPLVAIAYTGNGGIGASDDFTNYNYYVKTEHPSYDTYEFHYEIDYDTFLYDMGLDEGDLYGYTWGGHLYSYIENPVGVEITNYDVTVNDETNLVTSFDNYKNKRGYEYEKYETPKTSQGYYSYGGCRISITCDYDELLGGLTPNPKKILVNIAFTSQGVNRNLKVYFILHLI